MIVTGLQVTNLRAIKSAEFRFQQGFNLIVGLNGVGKTSALDALSVCLSAIVKRANSLRSRVGTLWVDDIRIGAEVVTVECDVQIGGQAYRYLIHRPRERSVPQKAKGGLPREQVHCTPGLAEFIDDPPSPVSGHEPDGRPLGVFFSTNRAVPSERAPGKGTASGGVTAAFANAFADRELRLGEFGAWLRVQESIRGERPASGRVLAAFQDSVIRFLPGYANLRLSGDDSPQILIDRDATTLPVQQLSDGERGILALVLDLTRRLSQANPNFTDPASEAEAVVLIDEVDLHLHPKWQRQIVHNLTRAFPRCQFIATTHSPQVVASVEPNQVHLLSPSEIGRPDRSLGMDSNWILRHLMEADDRPEAAMAAVKSVENLIEEGTFEEARVAISRARQDGLDLPEWSVLEARMARLEILAE
ncbi:MAG: AAA family ATPase [Chloroflexota bacterium]|nr:AAA family ATPase [Chloroflexota bacterium]